MLTPAGKQLKVKIMNYLDKLAAHVEELKERGIDTSLERVLKEQRSRVNATLDSRILLQVSDGDVLAQYLKRVDALEKQAKEDAEEPGERHSIERDSEVLDDYLEEVGKDIDELRERVQDEEKEYAEASDALGTLGSALRAAGAKTLVTSMFQKKSLTERLAARKARKRWLKTPGGRKSKIKEEKLAKRHHVIDRKRSKTAKINHAVYKY